MQTVALQADGTVAAWGVGQTSLPGEWPSAVTAIAVGNQHTVVLRTDGSVVAWGNNDYGQIDVPLAAQSE